MNVKATYIGGPTAIVEIEGLRFLTDPTFDAGGTSYELPIYTLRKTMGPAVAAEAIDDIDAVLLSHDQHFDNLDRAGRRVLSRARRVFAPPASAERLGGQVVGLAPWTSATLRTPGGGELRLTGTPARHGPPGGDRGPVIGFLITAEAGEHAPAVYISGDTVWFEGVEKVAESADVRVAFLFMGAARVREVGPAHLTFTADEGVLAARAMPNATIVPLHYEGWEHFSEARPQIEAAFNAAGLSRRLCWLPGGESVTLA